MPEFTEPQRRVLAVVDQCFEARGSNATNIVDRTVSEAAANRLVKAGVLEYRWHRGVPLYWRRRG